MTQGGLFQALPSGFEYRSDFLSHEEERELLREVEHVQFNRVEMRGAVARRRTAHYGYTYGYERRDAVAGVPIPGFLTYGRNFMRHEPPSEIPATSPNIGASRCHPIGAPSGYSVISASANASGSRRAHEATRARIDMRNPGIGTPATASRRS